MIDVPIISSVYLLRHRRGKRKTPLSLSHLSLSGLDDCCRPGPIFVYLLLCWVFYRGILELEDWLY